MVKGFISGSWDLLHAGHILALKEAREKCDYLVVAINVDPRTDRKWKRKPIETLEERKIRLSGCKYVDEIVWYYTEEECLDMLFKLNIDVRFLGGDYKDKQFPGCQLPIKHIFLNREHNYSSTNLIKRIQSQI